MKANKKNLSTLKNSKLICFVATAKAEAAKEFYQDVLGLKLAEEGPFALVFDANGTMLRIQKVKEFTALRHTALGWEVGDISATIRQLASAGVRFERYEGLSQDELGIWNTPSGAQVAWFNDPDGNILSLTQFK